MNSKRIAVVAVSGLIIVALGFIAGERYADREGDPPKQEHVSLRIGEGPTPGSCVLKEQTPPEIRTESRATVTWKIEGECPDHSIGIERQSIGEVFQDGRLEAPARANQMLIAILKDRLEKKTHHYRVLIDNQPAQFASPANTGTLRACPDWPCGRF